MKRLFFGALAAAALAGSAGATVRPPELSAVGIDQRLGEPVPMDLRFRDETGAEVDLRAVAGGRPLILTFGYFDCPMLCPLTFRSLAGTLDILPYELGEDFAVATVSIDPDDDPASARAMKKSVLERYHADGDVDAWRFLTADSDTIARITEATGYRFEKDDRRDEFAHGSALLLVTPEGRLSRYLYGIEVNPRDLRLGLVEASESRVGTLTDQVLLFCYRYDPETGKYGAIAMLSVRLGGAATLLGLGTFLVVMWRRESRGGKHRHEQ